MKQIIIDSSSKILYIAFVDNNKIIYESCKQGVNNHSDNLIKKIKEGLDKTNLKIKDFDSFIIGNGPGRYTGLRVGLAVLKTFSWTLNKPLYTLSSIDILFSGYLNTPGKYGIMLRAKKEYSYTKVMEVTKDVCLYKEEFKNDQEFILENQDCIILKNEDIKIDIIALLNLQNYHLVDKIHLISPNYLRKEKDVL